MQLCSHDPASETPQPPELHPLGSQRNCFENLEPIFYQAMPRNKGLWQPHAMVRQGDRCAARPSTVHHAMLPCKVSRMVSTTDTICSGGCQATRGLSSMISSKHSHSHSPGSCEFRAGKTGEQQAAPPQAPISLLTTQHTP